ncbi:hypothetical protein PFISCL1PPCAC_23883 [Pristionchus fissidentatus]|uniref:G protein-coupled receptor n=1 Tax=Pristionchus fissidentatus TaxID=1538716 RepID=A0AAV5WNN9_9BILA|nr:hypothetical protein PFISCL1PPCAC_23883 [Pristionchus fissidentatus]
METDTRFAFRFYANASIAEQFPLLFYSFYVLEILFHLLFLFFSPLVISAVYSTTLLHRNFRLFFCITMIGNDIAIFSRFVLLYYQYMGTPIYDSDVILIASQLYRESYFVLCTLIVFAGCADRLVATIYWEWYESASDATLLVLGFIYFLIYMPSIAISLGCLYRVIGPLQFILLTGCTQTVSILMLLYTRYLNESTLKSLRRWTSSQYCLTKAFQIQANIRILNIMQAMTISTVFFNGVASLFLISFQLLDSSLIQRNLVGTFLDTWCSIYGITYMMLSVRADKVFLQHISRFKILRRWEPKEDKESASLERQRDVEETTREYFNQLEKSWS